MRIRSAHCQRRIRSLAARECGYLALALAVCGALVNAGSHDWRQLLGLLREADLDALSIRLEDYPHPSLAVALAASVDSLAPQARDRYLQLAVFQGHGYVPAAALQVLWGLDQQHADALIGDLAHKSLLRAEDGRISLHDLQMDYLVRRAPDLPALHELLLAAYRDQCPGGWASGPDDGYFYQHLAHHLRQAARIPELTALLLDQDWMTAKLAAGTISALLADYDTGKQLHTLAGHDHSVYAVAVSADGRRAVTGGVEGTVRVWDLEEGIELAFFAADSDISELAITPGGTWVIARTSTGPVHLLELCGYEYAGDQPSAQEPRS